MISRRCRIQARPNVINGAKKCKPLPPRPVSPTKTPSDVLSPSSPPPPPAVTSLSKEGDIPEPEALSGAGVKREEPQTVPIFPEALPDESAAPSTSAVADVADRQSITDELVVRPVTPSQSLQLSSPRKSQSTSPLKSPRPRSPLKSPISVAGSAAFFGNEPSLTHRARTISSASSYQLSPTKSEKVRRKFTGDEPLDPKTMTMQDLIFWNPKNEKASSFSLQRLHEDLRKKRKDSTTESESSQKRDVESEQKKLPKPAFAAPQVKIAEDGTLVIDESSLTITNENDLSVWETVEEDRGNKKLNSMSFRKRPFCRGNPWSELETDLFYDILRATGPDFGLMHEFFPSRTRLELKAKYNREERFNWTRLNQALAVPTLLSDALYTHANEVIGRIKEEEIKKRELKLSKKSNAFSDTVSEAATVEWNEAEADLEAEAEEAILTMLEEDDEQPCASFQRKPRKVKMAARKKMKDALLNEAAEEAALVLKEKKYEKRKNELKRMSERALRALDEDFPKFEILVDENTDIVTVEARPASEGLPIVRIPLGTVTKVLPADSMHPQRVFFECSPKKGSAVLQYVVQHQMGPGQPSTGYLHLFGNGAS